MLHIPGLGFDGLVGYSPIAKAKNASASLWQRKSMARHFSRTVRVRAECLNIRVCSKTRRSSVRAGTPSTAMNTGRIAVLEEGVNYQQIAIPPEEVQSLGTRKFEIDEIARLYRVPACMAAILEKSSFNERHPLSYPMEAEEGESSILLTRIFLNSRRVTRSRRSCSMRRFHGEWISRNS